MEPRTFEDYLKDFHAENYHGTDDDIPDDFDNWSANMDLGEMEDLGFKAVGLAYKQGYENGLKASVAE